MRKEDLSKAIGDIDPKLIESSLAYRPAMSKHRLTKIVALAACLAIIVTAIPLALILNRESDNANDLPAITTKDNTVIDNHEPDKEEPLIIFCSSPTELKQQMNADAKVEIKDIAELNFHFNRKKNNVEKRPGVPYAKTVLIGENTFNISYTESYENDLATSSSNHMQEFGTYNVYDADYTDGVLYSKARFIFNDVTGKLNYYRISNGYIKEGNLSEQELIDKANKIIESYCGRDVIDETRYLLETHNVKNGSDSYYYFLYRRYIGEYRTNECITVSIDSSGQILQFDSTSKGYFDEFVLDKNVSDIDETKKAVLSTLNSNTVVIADDFLEINSEGNVALRIEVRNENHSYYIYANI